jgi:hypothetical protein
MQARGDLWRFAAEHKAKDKEEAVACTLLRLIKIIHRHV